METRGKSKGARVPRGTSPVGVTKMRFSVNLWNKWLEEFNREPEPSLVKGIEEFRALCRKPLDIESEQTYSSPTMRTTDK